MSLDARRLRKLVRHHPWLLALCQRQCLLTKHWTTGGSGRSCRRSCLLSDPITTIHNKTVRDEQRAL